ncbi:MAG TPA: succinate dehydrogenase, cytochrome b556 subunit [Gammaproteobacteria bacterium]|nr:succinate dehydrogenase, cytochrome b556 subunit [Gammaproteobacteria bacterium]
MITNRPLHINPFMVRMPIPALVSISHRLSGVAIFLLIPLLLWILDQSLISPENYETLNTYLQNWWLKPIVFIFILSLFFHLIAGIRHLLMDMHIGESLQGGRISSWIVFILAFLASLFSATWLWG